MGCSLNAGQPPYYGPSVTLTLKSDRVYFGGRMLRGESGWTGEDRLGSVGQFYPYGEARVGDPKRFATYERDGGGLDYAVNRYYWVGTGRFMSPDPYMANSGGAGDVADPGSWNRYGYVGGDPVNWVDPGGLCKMPGPHSEPRDDLCWASYNHTYSESVAVVSDNDTHTPSDPGYTAATRGDDALRLLAAAKAETCGIALIITMECGDAAVAAAVGARWWTGFATSWWAAAKLIGKAGELTVQRIIGLTHNTESLFVRATGNFRIPDFWDRSTNTIYEVKNVSELAFTSQIRDMALWAAENGGTFQLWVRNGAQLTPQMQQAVNQGLVQLHWFTWP
jgi:RHS repeat-associated protein